MIEFVKIRWKNLLSYGNVWTEVDFTNHKMTIVVGKNGSGKSVLLEALSFGLFGVPYRNMNKPNLVNSINQKDCLVEVYFTIGGKSYLVRRGIKPTVFEIFCNGTLVNQTTKVKDYQKHLEQNILKLTYKTFTQLVVLGSANFVPFMQLPALGRREVIEDLLDITVFSKMNVVLKERMAQAKAQCLDLEKAAVVIREKLDLQKKHIDGMKAKNQELIVSNEKQIQKGEAALVTIEIEIDRLGAEVQELLESISDHDGIMKKKVQCADALRAASGKINQLKKNIDFYEINNDCPTCGQHIDEEFKKKIVDDKSTKVKELTEGEEKVNRLHSELTTRLAQIDGVRARIQECNEAMSEKRSSRVGILAYVKKLRDDNRVLADSGVASTESAELQLSTFQSELDKTKDTKEQVLILQRHHEVCAGLLKDSGIKTKIIRQYLPLMNKYVNKYLNAMDFYVNFNLDENFKEVIKSRHRDEFEYNSFSEGEKFRIDMALLLTWREISRKKNSTNTNILILDEVFDSSLDGSGSEEFMKLLRALSQKINITVISHKPEIIGDKFDRTLTAEKKNNFSTLK